MTPNPNTQPIFKTVSIMGLGLIGGSMAKLIRQKLPQTIIWAHDIDTVSIEKACNEGVVTGYLPDLHDPKILESNLIVLGAHPKQNTIILEHLVQKSATPLQIIDLGSTKQSICLTAEGLPESFAFIGGHPLAGREVSGYANSRADLFSKKRFLLTPCQKTPELFLNQVVNWLKHLETIPIVIDYKQHDHLMSIVSHFPQFYAFALANLLHINNPTEVLQFLGGGIDDQMRLMASPEHMWQDIFQENKDNLNSVLTQFIELLTKLQEALKSNTLSPWIQNSHEVYQLYQSYKKT